MKIILFNIRWVFFVELDLLFGPPLLVFVSNNFFSSKQKTTNHEFAKSWAISRIFSSSSAQIIGWRKTANRSCPAPPWTSWSWTIWSRVSAPKAGQKGSCKSDLISVFQRGLKRRPKSSKKRPESTATSSWAAWTAGSRSGTRFRPERSPRRRPWCTNFTQNF